MFVLADPIVDWNAMWKIFAVVLVAGTGAVVAFGFLLLGLKFANRLGTGGAEGGGMSATGSGGARAGWLRVGPRVRRDRRRDRCGRRLRHGE